METIFTPIRWVDDRVELIDQRLLPKEEVWLRIDSVDAMADAIRSMAIRGAPAIGIATAMGIALAFRDVENVPDDIEDRTQYFQHVCSLLRSTRPTAVNLQWALERMGKIFENIKHRDAGFIYQRLKEEALRIHQEDINMNLAIGEFGAELFDKPVNILTICNTGALATGGYGTALGVIRSLFQKGRLKTVYACETRPFLQGSRLTMWELEREAIPGILICDGMAGYLMQKGMVDAVITGADRIVANGDTANKIGTYGLAVLAHYHRVPFYIAAPISTIDPGLPSGDEIPIEERNADEVRTVFGHPIAPPGCRVWNPAFDVTPSELITGIITDRGVLTPPYRDAIASLFKKENREGEIHSIEVS